MSSTRTEEYWSRFPDTYDESQEYVAGKQLIDDITQEINSLPELGDLVEFGCGTGRFTKTISVKAQSMVATDLSDTLLEVARARIGENPGITVQKEDCMVVSFPSESFDSAFMANLIHVIEKPEALLQECNRILKDNGTIVIATFTTHGMKRWEKIKMAFRFIRTWGKPPAHTHTFTPDILSKMMGDAGFSVETAKLIGSKSKAVFIIGRKVSDNK